MQTRGPVLSSTKASFTTAINQPFSTTFTNKGEAITSCSIAPTLPAGLTFDSKTCAISGTPTAVTSSTEYTITAESANGEQGTLKINLATTAVEGSNTIKAPILSATQTTHIVVKDTAFKLSISNKGAAISNCMITPALPTGLSINAKTCEISGTATVTADMKTYTITATAPNAQSHSLTINLKVNPLYHWLTQLGSITKKAGVTDANTGSDYCEGVAIDSQSNVYCAGSTNGALGEASGGNEDAFVMKLNPTGEIVWITQLGATTKKDGVTSANTGLDRCLSVALDSDNNVLCAGRTDGNLGEANGGSSDAFIMKLNNDGQLQWITQLGAATKKAGVTDANNNSGYCLSIAIDANNNVYCGGETNGNMGETNANSYDPFILKLNSAGVLQWITQLGSDTKVTGVANANLADDKCNSVTATTTHVYCAGGTLGALGENYVGGSNKRDAFVLKLNANDGSMVWLTQLGAETTKSEEHSNIENDFCSAITVDQESAVYCGGGTRSNLGENVATAAKSDPFVLKLKSTGEIEWLTQLGSQTKIPGLVDANLGEDSCYSIALDAYCGGRTDGAIGEANSGEGNQPTLDVFLLKLDAKGTLKNAKQLGAISKKAGVTDANKGVDSLKGIAIDSSFNIYFAGSVMGAIGEANGGGLDVFVGKIPFD